MDDSAPLMHVDWIRWFENLRTQLAQPIEINAGQITGGKPLTRVNDTNVTLTLGGTPVTALLKAVTLTLGWTGVLAATRGGTGFGSYAVGDLLYADTTASLAKLADVSAGSYLRSGGVSTAPLWSTVKIPNTATAGDLWYASASNTIIARAIGSANDVLTVSGGLPVWAAPAAAATVTITDDTTTNATMFPTWVTAASGNLPIKVSSTRLSFNPSTSVLQLQNTVTPNIRINLDTGTTSTGTLSFYEGVTEKAGVQYRGSTGSPSAARTDLTFFGGRIAYSVSRTLMDADTSVTSSRSLAIGKAANTLTGIELIANSTTWFIDHRGSNDATNNRLMFGTESTNNLLVVLRTGLVGIGTGSPANLLSLGLAGTTRGEMNFAGNTSGVLVLRGPSTASGTLTLPAGTTDFSATGGTGQVVQQSSAGGAFTVGAVNATTITDDTTTNATMYPVWVTAASGNLPLKVSSTKLSFNPSTGLLTTTAATILGTLTVSGPVFTSVVAQNDAASARLYQTFFRFNKNDGTQTFTFGNDLANSGTARFQIADGTAANVFLSIGTSGLTGVGVITATAILHLKAGTATANTAPLKFNSGTLLGTAEAGAVEFLTDAFYGTITTGAARKTFAFLEAPALTTWSSSGKLTNYNSVNTAGWGIPAIYASGRSVAQVAAVASVAAYTVGAADGSFRIDANVLVTTSTTHNFTVTCAYTDESNTGRTLTLTFSSLAGVFLTAITNVTGAGPYEGVILRIRCKASTAITIATVGTFTTVTYNVEATIEQVA